MAERPTFEMSPLGSSDPGWSDAQGCATLGLVVGAVVVAAGLLLGWVLLNTPDYASVGPGIGFFGFVLLSVSAVVGVLLGLFWLVHFRPGKGAAARTVAVVLGLFGIAALAVSAPWTPARTYFTPEIVGVVATSDYTPDGVEHVTLVDGRTFDVDSLRQSDGQPSTAGRYSFLSDRQGIDVGGLLLAGEHPTPWYSGTYAPYDQSGSGSASACYALDGTGVEHQDSVDMNSGLRLMKAPGYPNDYAVGYGFQGRVCLNVQGLATSVLGGD
jgi:hypothetical protein